MLMNELDRQVAGRTGRAPYVVDLFPEESLDSLKQRLQELREELGAKTEEEWLKEHPVPPKKTKKTKKVKKSKGVSFSPHISLWDPCTNEKTQEAMKENLRDVKARKAWKRAKKEIYYDRLFSYSK